MWLDFLIPEADQTLFIPSNLRLDSVPLIPNIVTRLAFPDNPLTLFFLFFFYFIFFFFPFLLLFSSPPLLFFFLRRWSREEVESWSPYIAKHII